VKITAEFVTSAAAAAGLPHDGLPEIAVVGRSNVGKSSLINALVRQRIARTSAAPGKTRLVNVYRVARGEAAPIYLVDLPGYGYARGGGAGEFARLMGEFFGTPRGRESPLEAAGRRGRGEAPGRGPAHVRPAVTAWPGPPARPAGPAVLLLVDARHPGLASDEAALAWLRTVGRVAVVATKIDKLARGERIRAARAFESVFHDSVLPVSAATGEGLDELWKLIDRLANSSRPTRGARPHRPPTG